LSLIKTNQIEARIEVNPSERQNSALNGKDGGVSGAAKKGAKSLPGARIVIWRRLIICHFF
jgi:hypothetical protein